MTDLTARRSYAELLRHLAAGLITNVEFEEQGERIFGAAGDDAALEAVRDAAWQLYDDFLIHRLRGSRALTPAGRSEVARWILFLYTDEEYRWPKGLHCSLGACALNLLTLGLWGWLAAPHITRKLRAIGNPDVWPFLTTHSFDEARSTLRLLGKQSSDLP